MKLPSISSPAVTGTSRKCNVPVGSVWSAPVRTAAVELKWSPAVLRLLRCSNRLYSSKQSQCQGFSVCSGTLGEPAQTLWRAEFGSHTEGSSGSCQWCWSVIYFFFSIVDEYKCTTYRKNCFKSVWNLCHFWCFPHPKTLLCMYCINLHLILQTVLSELKYSSHPCCVL